MPDTPTDSMQHICLYDNESKFQCMVQLVNELSLMVCLQLELDGQMSSNF